MMSIYQKSVLIISIKIFFLLIFNKRFTHYNFDNELILGAPLIFMHG